MHWLGFWIFLAVVYGCEAWLYSQGHNTLTHSHKTPHELRLREAAVSRQEENT